jgi:hypothetical protein
MAGGACASTSEASANTPPTSQSQNHEVFLGDEEIFDASLSTFYTFDKENGGAPPLAQHLKVIDLLLDRLTPRIVRARARARPAIWQSTFEAWWPF